MERLTNNITENFNGIKIKTNMIIPKNEVKSYDELEEWYQRCAEKLAYYEDLEERISSIYLGITIEMIVDEIESEHNKSIENISNLCKKLKEMR